ncbi:carboxymuconolactone decarboxylase family protein [Streptomyces sp. NPDC060209]|uniref:carboxymuconolactone decarboxylase family protein n=1 Tax=Streptomyces sp. NPDC060209 TaxID=3347073 RepID=UPI0036494CA6
MPRLPYPVWDDLPEETVAAIKDFPVPINSVRAIALAPTLTAPLLDLVTRMMTVLELRPKHREMLVLLVSHETHCRYEWLEHLPQAAAVGVTEADLLLIADPDERCTDQAERALLSAGRRYLRQAGWDGEPMQQLQVHFTARQIAEILFVLGAIRMFTLYINALDLEVDEAGDELAQGFASMATERGGQ